MAQTKPRRKTKHRGNAAGIVESRGRTGRKPTAEEKSGKAKGSKATQGKQDRFDKPPSWTSAFYKSMFAAVMVLLIGLFLIKQTTQAVVMFPVVLLFYVPISYYSDMWLYRRRQRQKAAKAGKA